MNTTSYQNAVKPVNNTSQHHVSSLFSMKLIWIHIIYIFITLCLSYLYKSKVIALKGADQAFDEVNKVLEKDNDLMAMGYNAEYWQLGRMVESYSTPALSELLLRVQTSFAASQTLQKSIAEIKKEFIQFYKNAEVSKTENMENQSDKLSKMFFQNGKLKPLRDSIQKYQEILLNTYYPSEQERLKNQYQTRSFMKNDTFWNHFSSLTPNAALTQLSSLQNKVIFDNSTFFHYVQQKFSSDNLIFNDYKIVVAPKKVNLSEGDSIEADVYLTNYAKNMDTYSTLKVNGKTIPTNLGVAHFVQEKPKVGINRLEAKAEIRNLVTGKTYTTTTLFEFLVSPKCCKDCK